MIEKICIQDLGDSFSFREKAQYVKPIRLQLTDARLVRASTGEANVYLKGSVCDKAGLAVLVFCFFTDKCEKELRGVNLTEFKSIEVTGKLFDWVRGIGVTLIECEPSIGSAK